MRSSPNKKIADLKNQLAKAEEDLAKKRTVADSVSALERQACLGQRKWRPIRK
jgi:hypothetical protein